MSDYEVNNASDGAGSGFTSNNAGQFDQADWNTYETGSSAKLTPPDDTYTLKLPVVTEEAFAKGDVGQLKATISPLTIVGGPHNNYEAKFWTVSNKKYKNRNASGMGDFLLAANSTYRPTSEAEWKIAVKATSGKIIQAKMRWEGYNSVTKAEFKGMEAFPLVGGARQPFIDFRKSDNVAITSEEAKKLGREETYRVWANLKVAKVLIPGK